jgi:hypothetical protein
MKQGINSNQNIPSYIGEIKSIVSENRVYPLKELFMQLRKNYPEVRSMRSLKKDIETYTEDFLVNSNNMIVSRQGLLNDILSIIAN